MALMLELSSPDLLRAQLGIMTDVELANALQVTPSTLATWRGKNYGPMRMHIGKAVFYRYVDVIEWIKSS